MAAASDEFIIAKLVPEEVWCGRSQGIQYNSKVTYASLQWSGRTGSLLQMNQLKFKIVGKLPIILEEFIEEYTPI